MSKNETWMTCKFAEEKGGTLILEFPVVKAQKGHGARRLDGLIVAGGAFRELKPDQAIDINGKDLIVIQTKASRLGMSVMGQAIFSIALVKRHFKPKSVRAVIVCTGHDEELEALLRPYKDVTVRVFPRKKSAG